VQAVRYVSMCWESYEQQSGIAIVSRPVGWKLLEEMLHHLVDCQRWTDGSRQSTFFGMCSRYSSRIAGLVMATSSVKAVCA
jgi:hypothetical protein